MVNALTTQVPHNAGFLFFGAFCAVAKRFMTSWP